MDISPLKYKTGGRVKKDYVHVASKFDDSFSYCL